MAAHRKCLKYIDEIVGLMGINGGKVCELGSCGLRGSAKEYLLDLCGYKSYGLRAYLDHLGFDVTVMDIAGGKDVLKVDLGLPIRERKLVGYFDLIVAFAFIEHIEDQFILFRNIHNLCKDGGVVILNCPQVDSYRKHGTWHYDLRFFKRLFRICGYEIIDFRISPLRYWKSDIGKLVVYVSYRKPSGKFIKKKEFPPPYFNLVGYEKDRATYDMYGVDRHGVGGEPVDED